MNLESYREIEMNIKARESTFNKRRLKTLN